jgi:hypothetical protein
MCFGSSWEWRKQKAQQPIFAPFLHCARAGQNHALWFQPFFFGSSREGGKETQPLVLIFSLRACRTEKCALVPTGNREWGRGAQPLVLIFSTARVQDRKMCFGSSREWLGERSKTAHLPFLHCTARAQDINKRFGSTPFFLVPAGRGEETQPPVLIFHCAHAGHKNTDVSTQNSRKVTKT